MAKENQWTNWKMLVTNYRAFLLLGSDDDGKLARFENFQIAATDKDFWNQDAAQIVSSFGDPILDFLKRCLLRPAPITEPKDVAWFLASYASRCQGSHGTRGGCRCTDQCAKGARTSPGLSFDAAKIEDGQRFFRSTLVQTLFYGVFRVGAVASQMDTRQHT